MRPLNPILRAMALALALASPFTAAAVQTVLLSSIASEIGQHMVIHAEFTQTRQMAALKRPVVNTGRIVYSRQHGVLWQIEKPYRMAYVLNEDKVVEIGDDGVRRERQVPALAQMGRVFRAALSADTGALGDYFDITVQGSAAQWTLDLQPRQPQMAQFIAMVQMEGDRFVQSLRMDEATGDRTTIRFRNTRGASELTEAEALLFRGGPRKP